MSEVTYPSENGALADEMIGAPSDYLRLLKPRVMSLVVFTALAGMAAAPAPFHPVLACASLLAIAVGAGASGALNMWYDWDIDALMTRTKTRPIPAGKITRDQALAFGIVLSAFSVLTLAYAANWLAAGLLAFTIFFYVVIYTMWLKRWTPQNIVIGGAAGAFPPMVGWAAMTGSLSLESFLFFAIIFFWTPAHFWALALFKSADYARAGVPMMPIAKGARRTRLEILIYALIVAPLGLTPWLLGGEGLFYAVVAVLGGVGMIVLAARVYADDQAANGDRAAKKLFAFSILYLFALFAAILTQHIATRLGFF